MRTVTLILTLSIALLAISARGDVDLQAGAAAYAVCASCHGVNAEGNAALPTTDDHAVRLDLVTEFGLLTRS